MKLVIAMDSFKGTLSSLKAGEIVAAAFREQFPDVEAQVFAISDGGEGTVEALAAEGERREISVAGPLGNPVRAEYLLRGTTAIMEMAQASGLTLVPGGRLDPTRATTYGTGQMILDALDHGAQRIILGIGGSATTDGGAGMAQALGVSLRDSVGNELEPGGGELGKAEVVDLSGLDPRIKNCEFIVACDVNNVLCGPDGAAHVYGPQKGASQEQVLALDAALAHFSRLVERAYGVACATREGAGAAGGLGFALLAFCGARLEPGIDVVLDAIGIDAHLKKADLAITGEGCMDAQSACGKAPAGFAARAQRYGVPVVAIAGQVKEGFEAVYECGIRAVVPCISRPMEWAEMMEKAGPSLYRAASLAARLIRTGAQSK